MSPRARVAMIVLALALLCAPAAHACQCLDKTFDEAVAGADIAFMGTVTAITIEPEPASTFSDVEMRPAAPCPLAPIDPSPQKGCIGGELLLGGRLPERLFDFGSHVYLEKLGQSSGGESVEVDKGCYLRCGLEPGEYSVKAAMYGEIDLEVERMTVVKAGAVSHVKLDYEPPSTLAYRSGRARFHIEEAWKGACAPSDVWVEYGGGIPTCGLPIGNIGGGRYTVFAKVVNGVPHVAHCDLHSIGSAYSSEDATRPPPFERKPLGCSNAGAPRPAPTGGCAHCAAGGGPPGSGLWAPLLVLLTRCRRRRAPGR